MTNRRLLITAILIAAVLAISPEHAVAQCNPICQGDFDLDSEVTVDEIVAAVGNALGSCGGSPEQKGCIASGGGVSTALCCAGGPEFPDTCGLGACSCAPQFSHNVSICSCAGDTCFDRDQRTCVTR